MKTALLKRLLCAATTAVLLVSLCACHNDDPSNEITLLEDITQYCFVTQNEFDEGYTCTVCDVYGNYIFRKSDLHAAPQVEAVDENIIKVFQQSDGSAEENWVIFCNVSRSSISPLFRDPLATKGVYVAYTDYLSDQHHVFVRNAMDETAPLNGYTLEDADEEDPVLGGKLNEEGDLEVTYLSKGKEKTVVVDMP